MGWFKASKKAKEAFGNAVSGAPEGGAVFIAGKQLRCSHCGGEMFTQSEAQLNTAGMSLLDLDWLNPTADVYICTECGHLEWFIRG